MRARALHLKSSLESSEYVCEWKALRVGQGGGDHAQDENQGGDSGAQQLRISVSVGGVPAAQAAAG